MNLDDEKITKVKNKKSFKIMLTYDKNFCIIEHVG